MNVVFMIMSKWKFLRLVDGGYVMGWDDFCMFMIVGMCCRGYFVVVIREFCCCVGVVKWDNLIEIELLEYVVCNEFNKIVNCVMVVLDFVKVVIINYLEG